MEEKKKEINKGDSPSKSDTITNYTGTGVWYWQNLEDPTGPKWVKYPQDIQEKIEKTFSLFHDSYTVKFVHDGKNYTIFPLGCLQVNGITGVARPIMQMISGNSSEPRWHWQEHTTEKWVAYPDEISYMIEDVRKQLQKIRVVEYEKEGNIHLIDLYSLIDTNTVTNRYCEIIRKEN